MAMTQQQEHMVTGQAAVWGCIFGYIDTMALRCVIKLGIPDIISSHGHPISLAQISKDINHPSLDTGRLSRVMTLLVRRGIFSANSSDSGRLYGPTAASELLLSTPEKKSLAPMAMDNSNESWLSLWQQFDDCVKCGFDAYTLRFGMDKWSYLSANPEYCTMFQQCLASLARTVSDALKIGYLQNGLKGVGSLVDVGGGNGALLSEIVKEFPHVKGINFDLPFVVAAAPEYPGVTHVGGDMLISIPPADAILIKSVFHNWDDESGIQLLKNCRKAIPKETGKVIIVEMIIDPDGNDPFDHAIVAADLQMMVAHGAKERSEMEWKILLEQAGFSRYKIIKIPSLLSVIEANPEN